MRKIKYDLADRSLTQCLGTRILAIGLLLSGTGCSMLGFDQSTNAQTRAQELVALTPPAPKVPGAVEYVWEEPMVDVVDVPPGLDPEGIYYRPAHQEIQEIRQGRWKYYKEK